MQKQTPGICVHFTLGHYELEKNKQASKQKTNKQTKYPKQNKTKTVLEEDLVSSAPQTPRYYTVVQGQGPLSSTWQPGSQILSQYLLQSSLKKWCLELRFPILCVHIQIYKLLILVRTLRHQNMD